MPQPTPACIRRLDETDVCYSGPRVDQRTAPRQEGHCHPAVRALAWHGNQAERRTRASQLSCRAALSLRNEPPFYVAPSLRNQPEPAFFRRAYGGRGPAFLVGPNLRLRREATGSGAPEKAACTVGT